MLQISCACSASVLRGQKGRCHGEKASTVLAITLTTAIIVVILQHADDLTAPSLSSETRDGQRDGTLRKMQAGRDDVAE